VGKTALALSIVEHVALEAGVPTLLVSLDLGRLEIIHRMLCCQGKVDAHKFLSGFLSRDDRQKLIEARARIQDAPFFIDDTPNRSVPEIAALAHRTKQDRNLGLLIIDDLQSISPDDLQYHVRDNLRI